MKKAALIIIIFYLLVEISGISYRRLQYKNKNTAKPGRASDGLYQETIQMDDPGDERIAEPEMDIDPVTDEVPEDEQGTVVIDERLWKKEIPPPPPVIDEPLIGPPIEDMPVPVGGFEAIYKKLIYPEKEEKAGIQGRVFIYVLISKHGTVLETKVLKSVSPGLDQAAVDAIKAVEWIPAKERDKPVSRWVAVPIDFKLKPEE